MRRNYWVVVASVLVIGVLTGCSENTVVAPSATPSAESASLLAPSARPQLSLSGAGQRDGVTKFTVKPSGGIFFVGNHAVVFPAHSICDPATSTYGEGQWDVPCTALNRPLTITARLSTANGVRAVDFSPEIRFVPSASPDRWVWIFMYTPEARGASDLSPFGIFFSPSLGATPVNDARSDVTLRTYVDTWSGMSFRRIKHFTGYAVGSGFTETPPPDDPTLPLPASQAP